MANYIYVVTEHRELNNGIPVSTNHYYRAESEEKAKAKYAELCAKYLRMDGCECTHDDRFGTIEDVDGREFYSSFMDFRRHTKTGIKSYEVEFGIEPIK